MTDFKRRTVLKGGVMLLASVTGVAAFAQTSDYPSKPIRILVEYGAGTSTDLLARLYGEKLREELGATVVVENKPGAGGILAVQELLKSPADGYTLLVATASNLSHGPAVREVRHDPLKDFEYISLLGTNNAAILVAKDNPAQTLAGFIEHARANPGVVTYGSAGVGATNHILGEYMQRETGVELVHVPYKSDPETATEVGEGRLDMAIGNVRSILPILETGKVKALAVISFERAPQLPDVPTVAETGIPGLDKMAPYSFFGFIGPAGMPPEVVATLRGAIDKALDDPEVIAQSRDNLLIDPAATEGMDYRTLVEESLAKWKSLGLKLDG